MIGFYLIVIIIYIFVQYAIIRFAVKHALEDIGVYIKHVDRTSDDQNEIK